MIRLIQQDRHYQLHFTRWAFTPRELTCQGINSQVLLILAFLFLTQNWFLNVNMWLVPWCVLCFKRYYLTQKKCSLMERGSQAHIYIQATKYNTIKIIQNLFFMKEWWLSIFSSIAFGSASLWGRNEPSWKPTLLSDICVPGIELSAFRILTQWNPHSKFTRKATLSSTFCRWRKWGSYQSKKQKKRIPRITSKNHQKLNNLGRESKRILMMADFQSTGNWR